MVGSVVCYRCKYFTLDNEGFVFFFLDFHQQSEQVFQFIAFYLKIISQQFCVAKPAHVIMLPSFLVRDWQLCHVNMLHFPGG
jgi:hypothetical protein